MNINEDILLSKAKNIKEFDSFNRYDTSYQEFLKFFKDRQIDKHNLILGCYFTYGWMPTILKNFDSTKINDSIINALNGVKDGKELNHEDLTIIKEILNNSIIGASKLLHFINPKLYPIWDSRVCGFIYDDKKNHSFVNNVSRYEQYVSKIKSLSEDTKIQQMCKNVRFKLNCELTNIRVIELIMFEKG